MTLIEPLHIVLRALFVLALLLLVGPSSPASGEPEPDQTTEIIIGQPLYRALVSACVTREQAESVLRAYNDKSPEESEKAFAENGCFVLYMNLVPRSLISSRRIGNRVLSIVEIAVRTGLVSQHIIYMITPNPVIVGTRV